MIDNEIIEDIKSKADIVSIVGQHAQISKKGRNYWAVCPFHEDTSPSMSVSPEKQIYKCFVCGAGGNAFKFLQEFKNISFVEAVHDVADQIGYDKSKLGQLRQKKVDVKQQAMFDINKDAMNYFKTILKTVEGEKAKKYLFGRKIFEEEINKYNIGYAANSGLVNFLEKKGYPFAMISAAGLGSQNEGEKYDQFRNRIIFPIQDASGNVLGFSGRTLNTDSKFAKYINSKETYVFKKKDILYNINNAYNEIRKTKKVYVCEGFTDVITLNRCGINNAVAVMGTAITKEHVAIIEKVANEIILIMDGDNAGIASAFKSLEILNKTQLKRTVVPLPIKKDVEDVYSDKGEKYLIDFIENKSISWIKFEVNYLAYKHKKDISIMAKEMIERLKFIDDEIEHNLYAKEVAKKTELGIDSILKRDKITNKELEPTAVFTLDQIQPEEKQYKKETQVKQQPQNKLLIETGEEDLIRRIEENIIHQIVINNDAIKKYRNSKMSVDEINDTIINYIDSEEIDNYDDLITKINLSNASDKDELLMRVIKIKSKFKNKKANDTSVEELLERLLKLKGR